MDHHRSAYRGWSRENSDGQTLLIFAVFSLVLIGMLALAIDGGFLISERRQAQSAADAAALAAAKAALDKRPSSEVSATGVTYGSLNANVPSANVVINRPPSSGDHAGDNNYVEALVTKSVTKYFLGAVYTGNWQVTAKAVAGIEPVKKPYALVALRAPGIDISGSGTITIDGAGSMMSNSNITSSGTSNVVTVGGSIDANGTIEEQPAWTAQDGINEGVNVVIDPLAGTPAPPMSTPRTWPTSCNPTCDLYPGYYNNLGIFTVPPNSKAILHAGVYYFNGNSRLRNQSTDSWIVSADGEGVMLYFAGNSRFEPRNGNVILRAPNTSPYAGGADGMVVWIANCSELDSPGNGTFAITGIIYAPCSHVSLHGTPGSNGVQVIVGDLQLNGTSDFNIEYKEWVKFDVPKVWLVE